MLATLATWLTPIWLLAAGAALGLLVLLAGLAVVRAVSRRVFYAAFEAAREGPLAWVLGTAGAMSLLAAVGLLLVDWQPLVQSAARLPLAGTVAWRVLVPPRTENQPIELRVAVRELQSLTIASDRPVTMLAGSAGAGRPQDFVFLTPDRPANWSRSSRRGTPLDERLAELTATNATDQPVMLRISADASVEHPEAAVVPITAASLVGLVLALLGIRAALPKVWVIALASFREILSQRVVWLLAVPAALLLQPLVFPILIYLPYNTLSGEDVKMLKHTGVMLTTVLGIFVGLWSASTSLSEEVEGRTISTLLAKPISRRQLILGKFLGIVWAVGALSLVLGLLLLGTIARKVVHDAPSAVSAGLVTWQVCHQEMIRTAPALVLGFMQAVMLTAVAVAISTRLPMLANLVLSGSIYAAGHMVPLLVDAAGGRFPIVTFMGQLLGTVLPVLDHFKVPGAIVGDNPVPLAYLGWAALYATIYSTIAILVALALFEDRDLA